MVIRISKTSNRIPVTDVKLGQHFAFMDNLYVRVPGPNPSGQAGTSIYAYKYGEGAGINTTPTVFMKDQTVTRVSGIDIKVTV